MSIIRGRLECTKLHEWLLKTVVSPFSTTTQFSEVFLLVRVGEVAKTHQIKRIPFPMHRRNRINGRFDVALMVRNQYRFRSYRVVQRASARQHG
jgi:hypothetical protein